MSLENPPTETYNCKRGSKFIKRKINDWGKP